MNSIEKDMVKILTELREKHNATGIKAEFEAEGTRMDEAMRLKDVCSRAGLGLNMKIGGCEAIKDMFDAISLGVDRIIGPMVETAYALKKYLGAVKIAFTSNDIHDVEFLINLETITSFNNFDEMLKLPEIGKLKGIVIGRVDLTGSLGMTRDDVNSKQILDLSVKAAEKAKSKGLDVVVGGGVSVDSMEFFRSFPKGTIDRFETRKVIFSCPSALENKKEAFLRANEFELLWLKNKKNYYGSIHNEDNARIDMLEARYKKQIESLK